MGQSEAERREETKALKYMHKGLERSQVCEGLPSLWLMSHSELRTGTSENFYLLMQCPL